MSNSKPTSDYFRLCKAIENRDNATVSKLLRNNIGLNFPNIKGHTPLHLAIIKYCDMDIVTMLLDKGANVHAKNHHNHKPLEVAIHNYNTTAASLLLERGALIGEDFNALLYEVIRKNYYELAKVLINYESQNNPSIDLKKFLNLAISKSQPRIIGIILSHCKFDQPSELYIPKEAVIDSTAYHGNCVDVLLKWNFTVSPDCKNDRDFIYAAVEKGYLPIVLQLLKLGINVNLIYPKSGLNILKVACFKKHHEIVANLLKHNARINQTTPTNYELLDNLLQVGFTSISSSIRKKGGFFGITCLHIAVLNSDLKMTRLLLEHGATIVDDPSFFNITRIAIRYNCEEIVRLFLDHGVDVNHVDLQGKTLLHYCVSSFFCQDHLFNITELLLEKGGVNHIRAPGNILLFEAIKNKHKQIAQLFLDHKADIQYVDPTGTTLLHEAIENDFDVTFIESLLQLGFPVNAINSNKLTSLLYTCKYHFNNLSNVVKVLLDYDADVNCTDDNLMTPLHFACLKNNLEVVAALLEKGANPSAKTKEGRTPLHYVCENNDVKIYFSKKNESVPGIIELLLHYDANIEAVDAKGWTPLFAACKTNNSVAVKCFLNHDADANHMDVNKLTPICIAAKNCTYNTEVLKMLLEQKVNVNYIDEEGKSIVHMIIYENKVELTKSLALAEANFNTVDKKGDSPLHVAVCNKYVNMTQSLLKYGSNVNILNKKKHTPLRVALKYLVHYRKKHLSIRDNSKGDEYDNCFWYEYIDDIVAYKKIMKYLKIQVIKLKVAGLKVNHQNFDIVYNSQGSHIYNNELFEVEDARIQPLDILKIEVKCEAEIEKMKMKKIRVENMTFYDLLTKNIHLLSRYVRNPKIERILELESYDKKFPLYIDIVRNRFREAKFRFKMSNLAKKCFILNVYQLPDNCLDSIFTYFKTKDLNIFIRAMKGFDD